MAPAVVPDAGTEVFWRTPIFHPNIDLRTGKVCLGALGDRYRPALDFGELCRLLIDIASYINYAVEGVYNANARNWALSDAGQIAIEQRGGQSVLRKEQDERRVPSPLWIRRVDS